MAYIYLITNVINNKQYVGQTVNKVQRRFNQHKNSAYNIKDKDNKAPLHQAIKKYGIENFTVEILEECPNNQLNEREIYWINKLDTYQKGYNASLGGNGKTLYNYQDIANYYKKTLSKIDTQKYFNCDYGTVKRALEEYKILELPTGQLSKQRYGHKIARCDLETEEILQTYNSQVEAAKDMYYKGYAKININNKQSVKGTASRIGSVVRGKLTQTYGFSWKRLDDD